MIGKCQNCNQNNGQLYKFHYGAIAAEFDKDAVSLWNNKSIAYKILGESEAFICQECVTKHLNASKMRMLLISLFLLLFGVFGYLISEYNWRWEDFINCLRAVLGIIGFFGLLLSFNLYSKPDARENVAISIAAKVNKIKEKTGANVYFNQKDFANLEPRQTFPTFTTDESRSNRPQGAITSSVPTTTKTTLDSTVYVPTSRTTTIICPICGLENSAQAARCQDCTWPLDKAIEDSTNIPLQSGSGARPQAKVSPQVNTSANLAILNAIVIIPVAIMQFLSGDNGALTAGVINTFVAIQYFLVSFGLRNRDPQAYKSALSMSKWGMLWTAGLAIYSISQFGGIGSIIGIWFAADAWLYQTLKSAEYEFPQN